MNTLLKDVNQNAYPATGSSGGVYLNYVTNPSTGALTMAGGGLYVQGNASILLTAQTGPAPSNDPQQVISITQGSTTTTMTVDPVANTTVVSSGTTTLTLAGVPANCSNFGAPPNPKATPPSFCTTVPSLTSGSTPGTMVYVNGTITSMSGPGQGVGAIQDQSAVTISALGDVNITGDVVYKTEPVTTTQNQIPGAPAVATLINGNDHNQDLGIFTANGNIILSTPYSNGNLEVDGAQAVIGQSCASNSCGFLVSGCINTFNNVGGQMQTNIFGACLSTAEYLLRSPLHVARRVRAAMVSLDDDNQHRFLRHAGTHHHGATHLVGIELRPVTGTPDPGKRCLTQYRHVKGGDAERARRCRARIRETRW